MEKSKRVTPEKITKLKPQELFVFGSNDGGRHSHGASKDALKFGAQMGNSSGIQGQSYAITTKHLVKAEKVSYTKSLPLWVIAQQVFYFREFTEEESEIFDKIYITAIGTGHAGYRPEEIAPLFDWALSNEKIYLPQSFLDVLDRIAPKIKILDDNRDKIQESIMSIREINMKMSNWELANKPGVNTDLSSEDTKKTEYKLLSLLDRFYNEVKKDIYCLMQKKK
jgi:hypothetical protein